jgi:hypothetical protein
MHLERDGFWLARDVVSDSARTALLELSSSARDVTQRGGVAFAARSLLQQVPRLCSELRDGGLDALASEALGAPAFAVDATFFDKPAGANWAVPAHQDRLLPVQEGATGVGVRRRSGASFADLDAATLGELIALRLHFDDADESNGALSVLPGSHRAGVLTAADIAVQPPSSFHLCRARAGDVMLMRPLLLHRSARSLGGRRRVLHVVYATRHPSASVRFRTD